MRLPLLLVAVFEASLLQAQTTTVSFPDYGLINGMSNPISVNVEGVLDDSIELTCSNGSIKRLEKNNYTYDPDTLGITIITVSANVNGRLTEIGRYIKHVNSVPLPVVRLSGYIPGRISKEKIKNIKNHRLYAINEFLGTTWCGITPKIKSFDLIVWNANETDKCKVYPSVNNSFDSSMHQALAQLKAGDRFVIASIHTATVFGLKYLQPVQYIVTD